MENERSKPRLAGWVVYLVLLVGPFVFLIWLRLGAEDRLAEMEIEPTPIVIEAEESAWLDPQSVTIIPSWSSPTEVVSPSWSGTVTAVAVAPGVVIEDGDVLLSVDDIDRVAVATLRPWFRKLGPGDIGTDVLELEKYLVELGQFGEDPDDRYSRSTGVAVDAWARTLGVAAADGVFDPGWTVWLRETPFELGQVNAVVGAPAPAPGEPLLIGRPELVTFEILPGPESAAVDLAGERVLIIGDQSFPVADGTVDPAVVASVSEVLSPNSEEIQASLSLANPQSVIVLPTSAIVVDRETRTCVFQPSGETFEPVLITLGSGRAATVDVVAGLQSGDVVLANPADILFEPSCA